MKKWIITGSVSGFLAVAFGAFGAHALKSSLSPEMLDIYKTGVFYHLIHSVIITATGLSEKQEYSKSSLFFTVGILLFSGSLYLYSITGTMFFAMVTPFGGVSFLIGWLLITFTAVKTNS
ncbi:MAG TPA: DUF423 domain-containing protein [Ignavibacteria bacterium]|jgi:uncharacterized membrane protein YgdD (TMEM256/DUF423 family)